MYCQTAAIVAYASELAGLTKLSAEESLRANMIVETVKQVQDEVTKPAFSARSAIPEDRKCQFHNSGSELKSTTNFGESRNGF